MADPSWLHKAPLSSQGRTLRLVGLSVVTSPILGAYFFGHSGYSSPFSCPILHFTGIPCPGCGMTRSFLAIARGDLPTAFEYHLFGPLFFSAIVLGMGYLSLEILTRQRWSIPRLSRWWQRWHIALMLLTLLGIYHLNRLYHLAQNGHLAQTIAQAPLGQWLSPWF